MNAVLFDLLDHICTAYLDDILIYSEDPLEHEAHVRQVLQRLLDAGLQVDIKKCDFSTTRTKFLGFILTDKGVKADPEKVAIISQWQEPKTKKGIQSFLGFCNFYRMFIKGYGHIARPLTQLTRKGIDRIELSEEARKSFQTLRQALVNAPTLVHFDHELPTRVETDCSDVATGGVLLQYQADNQWHPVAFFSRVLQAAESNYEIHDKELLAIIQALKEWRAELMSVPEFLIVTDHRAIKYFRNNYLIAGRYVGPSYYLSIRLRSHTDQARRTSSRSF